MTITTGAGVGARVGAGVGAVNLRRRVLITITCVGAGVGDGVGAGVLRRRKEKGVVEDVVVVMVVVAPISSTLLFSVLTVESSFPTFLLTSLTDERTFSEFEDTPSTLSVSVSRVLSIFVNSF